MRAKVKKKAFLTNTFQGSGVQTYVYSLVISLVSQQSLMHPPETSCMPLAIVMLLHCASVTELGANSMDVEQKRDHSGLEKQVQEIIAYNMD